MLADLIRVGYLPGVWLLQEVELSETWAERCTYVYQLVGAQRAVLWNSNLNATTSLRATV